MRLPESAGQEQYLGDSRAQSRRNQHCLHMVVLSLAEIDSDLMIQYSWHTVSSIRTKISSKLTVCKKLSRDRVGEGGLRGGEGGGGDPHGRGAESGESNCII